MRKLIILISILVAIAVIGGWWYLQNFKVKEEVHYHAGFQIYVNGQEQDFSRIEFMHIKPCNADGEDEHDLNDPIERVHLHDSVGDVAHVHDDGVTWRLLFSNLKVNTEGVKGYINGQEVGGFLDQVIEPYVSLVVFEGEVSSNVEELLSQRVTREHIVEVEGKSESCGS